MSAPTAKSLSSACLNMPHSQQMIAVDVLEVPLLVNNNRYLLVVQDYYTKWADAISLPDQTAARITGELVKIFSIFGHPEILLSDQGRNLPCTNTASLWGAQIPNNSIPPPRKWYGRTFQSIAPSTLESLC